MFYPMVIFKTVMSLTMEPKTTDKSNSQMVVVPQQMVVSNPQQLMVPQQPVVSNLQRLSPLKPFRPRTDEEIWAELHPRMDTRNPLSIFADFDKSRTTQAVVEARERARHAVSVQQARPTINDNLVG
jgi:hypothetical protein